MNILIIGAGAYGLALAENLTIKNNVTVYSSRKEEIENLNNNYSNEILFPNIKLSKTIIFTNNLEPQKFDLILLAIPSNYFMTIIEKLKNKINKKTIICIATKGLINEEFSHDIVKKQLKTKNICILSGPSFANDLIKKEKIILTISGYNKIKNIFSPNIKIEETKDLIGIQICGVLKNIFAIGSGIMDGLETSESTKAAYITKIINETTKIIVSLKGKKKTINNACGIGDIILTCSSKSSRNYTFGYLLGQNSDYQDYLENTTVEGVTSLLDIKQLLNKHQIKSEIINIIYNIVYNKENTHKLLNYIIK